MEQMSLKELVLYLITIQKDLRANSDEIVEILQRLETSLQAVNLTLSEIRDA